VQNALKEGGGGDDYNKVVEELKMISAKLNEIQYPENEQDEEKTRTGMKKMGVVGILVQQCKLIYICIRVNTSVSTLILFFQNCILRDIFFAFTCKT